MMEPAQNREASQFAAEKISGGVWRLFIFSLFVFAVTLVAYLGLKFGYQNFVQGRIDSVNRQITALDQQALPEEQEQYVKFYFQLVNLQNILNNHTAASRFFPLLQTNTNQLVAYNSIGVDTSGIVNLSGAAQDFRVLAQQLKVFEEMPEVSKVEIQNASENEGRVSFQINLSLRPEVFK